MRLHKRVRTRSQRERGKRALWFILAAIFVPGEQFELFILIEVLDLLVVSLLLAVADKLILVCFNQG
jgi:hypothetical protein